MWVFYYIQAWISGMVNSFARSMHACGSVCLSQSDPIVFGSYMTPLLFWEGSGTRS